MPLGSWRVNRALPVASSHTVAWPVSSGSDDAAARYLPSGEKASARTEGPVLNGLPAPARQRAPAAQAMASDECMSKLQGHDVEDQHRAVDQCRRQKTPVGRI